MAKVEPVLSRGQHATKVFTMGKAVYLQLGSVGDSRLPDPDRILFSDGVPVAIVTGGVMYVQDTYRTKGVSTHVNKFTEETESDTVVRTSPDNFDFILGSVFTKAGLPLTKRRTDGTG